MKHACRLFASLGLLAGSSAPLGPLWKRRRPLRRPPTSRSSRPRNRRSQACKVRPSDPRRSARPGRRRSSSCGLPRDRRRMVSPKTKSKTTCARPSSFSIVARRIPCRMSDCSAPKRTSFAGRCSITLRLRECRRPGLSFGAEDRVRRRLRQFDVLALRTRSCSRRSKTPLTTPSPVMRGPTIP
jgi:hypothetical protein